MVTYNRFELNETGSKILVHITGIAESFATGFRLYDSYTYPDKEKSYIFDSKLTEQSSEQIFEIDATEIGELFFDGFFIGEVTYEIPAGLSTVTYNKQAVLAGMTKIYNCIVANAAMLEVDDCKLSLKNSNCSCVEDTYHSFIELESFKILLKSGEFKLATEVFNSLNDKCSLNCVGLSELAIQPTIGIGTINDKIIE